MLSSELEPSAELTALQILFLARFNNPEQIPDEETYLNEEAHARDVLRWVRKLARGECPLELEVAAILHDVDRLVHPEKASYKGDRSSPEYAEYKQLHAKRSAEYVEPKLREAGLDEDIVWQAVFFITHHDDPEERIAYYDDRELELLAAADVFSFFSNIAHRYLVEKGEKHLREKTAFMLGKVKPEILKLLQKERIPNEIVDKIMHEVIVELLLEAKKRARSRKGFSRSVGL